MHAFHDSLCPYMHYRSTFLYFSPLSLSQLWISNAWWWWMWNMVGTGYILFVQSLVQGLINLTAGQYDFQFHTIWSQQIHPKYIYMLCFGSSLYHLMIRSSSFVSIPTTIITVGVALIILFLLLLLPIVMAYTQHTYGTNTFRYSFRRYSFRISSSSSSTDKWKAEGWHHSHQPQPNWIWLLRQSGTMCGSCNK